MLTRLEPRQQDSRALRKISIPESTVSRALDLTLATSLRDSRATTKMPQFHALTTLPRASSGYEPGIRLPGVRQLLLPHSFDASGPSSPSPQYLSEQSRTFSLATTFSPLDTYPSPQKRASESGIRTVQSDRSESLVRREFRDQASETFHLDAMVAIHRKRPQGVEASLQQYSQMSPRQEVFMSPRFQQQSSIRTSPPERSPPKSASAPGFATFGSVVRQYSGSYDVDRHSQDSGGADPLYDAHSDQGWVQQRRGSPENVLRKPVSIAGTRKSAAILTLTVLSVHSARELISVADSKACAWVRTRFGGSKTKKLIKVQVSICSSSPNCSR